MINLIIVLSRRSGLDYVVTVTGPARGPPYAWGGTEMRVKTFILGSASLTILALAASPAFAQTGGTTAGPPTGAATTGADAATAQPGAVADAGDDAIVVTGLRRS